MRHSVLFCATLFAISATAQAEEREGLSLSIRSDLQQFDYREFSDQGRLLDRESGFLPGLLVGANQWYGEWRFAGQLSYHAGSVTYDGQTNTGIPLSTTTRQRIIGLELRSERHFDSHRELRPVGYFGAAHRVWRRDIRPSYTASGQPVLGLLEIYRWWQAFFGARVTVFESPQAEWEADLRAIRLLAPKMVVDYAGLYDNPRLSLGERWGFRLAAPLSYKVRQSTTIAVEPYLERFALGRSALAPLTRQGVPVGAVFEPDSKTRNYGLVIFVEERF